MAVKYEADVGLIDAHAKRCGCHHHLYFVAHKLVLKTGAIALFQACMVSNRFNTLFSKI